MSLDVAILSRQAVGALTPADGGLTSDGPTQLAQRVVIELHTDADSAAGLPGRGTGLAAALRQRVFASEYDVLSFLAAALADVADAVRAEEGPDDDPASRLGHVAAERLVVLPGALLLTLTVQSRAGTADAVTFPVRVRF